jgi:hypothetical protein
MADESSAVSLCFKQIGQYSPDGLQVVLQSKLGLGELTALHKTLRKIIDPLTKTTPSQSIKKRKVTTAMLPSSAEVFKSKILPQVREHLAILTTEEMRCIPKIDTVTSFNTDYSKMTLEEIKREHQMLMMADEKVTNVQLVIRFHRGLLYLETSMQQEITNVKNWISEELGVSYDVARRYMTVALLLRRFPRLLACGLSFDQLAKHNKNFLDYFSTENEGLQDSLAVRYEIVALGKKIVVIPGEVNVPALEYGNLDPDSGYYPSNPTSSLDVDDDEFNRWKSVDADALPKLLWPADDVAEDLETIVTKAAEMTVSSPPFVSVSSRYVGGMGCDVSKATECTNRKNK